MDLMELEVTGWISVTPLFSKVLFLKRSPLTKAIVKTLTPKLLPKDRESAAGVGKSLGPKLAIKKRPAASCTSQLFAHP